MAFGGRGGPACACKSSGLQVSVILLSVCLMLLKSGPAGVQFSWQRYRE